MMRVCLLFVLFAVFYSVRSESICPFGQELKGSECVPCPIAWFRDPDGGSDVCEYCSDGFTTATTGTDSGMDCIPDCKAGTYYLGECVACAIGSFSEDNAWGCVFCGDGWTTNYVGSTVFDCIPDAEAEKPCPNGMFRDMNTAACETCPKNTYSLGGVTACSPCPEGTVSLAGSPSSLYCKQPEVKDKEEVTKAETEPPKVETDPPKVETDPPKVETDPPKVETDPPKVETDPPKVETDPPKVETDPPKVETDPPKVETDPPKVETDPPKVETDPPKVETDPPKVETDPPKVETEPPKVETKPPKEATDPPVETDSLKVVVTETEDIDTFIFSCEGAPSGSETNWYLGNNLVGSMVSYRASFSCEEVVVSCKVGEGSGSVTMRAPAISFLSSVTPILAKAGDSVDMKCGEMSGVTYTWSKADRFSGSVSIYPIGADSGTFTLDPISADDAGRYTCQATRCPTDAPVTKEWNVGVESQVKEEKASCMIYGDPHIKTFDGLLFDYQASCTYMLAMDCSKYTWYIYGLFGPCGAGTTLESLTVFSFPENDRSNGAKFELKRGFAVNDDGFLWGVKEGETKTIKDAKITFDGKLMKVSFGGVELYWDGLNFAKILVNKGAPTCGVCADNDGNPSNDNSATLYDIDNKSVSFADTWAIQPQVYGCVKGLTHTSPPESNLAIIKKVFYSASSPISLLDENTLKSVDIETFIQHAAIEYHTQSIFSDIRISSCQVLSAFLDLLHSKGIHIDRIDVDSDCPNPQQIRTEAIRLGCPWSQSNVPFQI